MPEQEEYETRNEFKVNALCLYDLAVSELENLQACSEFYCNAKSPKTHCVMNKGSKGMEVSIGPDINISTTIGMDCQESVSNIYVHDQQSAERVTFPAV